MAKWKKKHEQRRIRTRLGGGIITVFIYIGIGIQAFAQEAGVGMQGMQHHEFHGPEMVSQMSCAEYVHPPRETDQNSGHPTIETTCTRPVGFTADDSTESNPTRNSYRGNRSGGRMREFGNEFAAGVKCTAKKRNCTGIGFEDHRQHESLHYACNKASSRYRRKDCGTNQRESMERDITEAEDRLKAMEAEAAKQLNVQPKLAENTSSGLEDAVRMLLVAMHACQTLPPNLAEACAAVSTCLPQPGVSEDVHEMSTDGGVNLKEEDVPAGQLDVALPSGSSERTVVVWEAPLSGKREELETCVTDEQFLAWAKAAKRSRPAPY